MYPVPSDGALVYPGGLRFPQRPRRARARAAVLLLAVFLSLLLISPRSRIARGAKRGEVQNVPNTYLQT